MGRGKGYQRWIKMSGKVLGWFLEVLDLFCKWKGERLLQREMKDNGRWFKAGLWQNKAGRNLLLSVISEDARRYFVIIPEGSDLLGWAVTGRKLWEMGIEALMGSMEARASLNR